MNVNKQILCKVFLVISLLCLHPRLQAQDTYLPIEKSSSYHSSDSSLSNGEGVIPAAVMAGATYYGLTQYVGRQAYNQVPVTRFGQNRLSYFQPTGKNLAFHRALSIQNLRLQKTPNIGLIGRHGMKFNPIGQSFVNRALARDAITIIQNGADEVRIYSCRSGQPKNMSAIVRKVSKNLKPGQTVVMQFSNGIYGVDGRQYSSKWNAVRGHNPLSKSYSRVPATGALRLSMSPIKSPTLNGAGVFMVWSALGDLATVTLSSSDHPGSMALMAFSNFPNDPFARFEASTQMSAFFNEVQQDSRDTLERGFFSDFSEYHRFDRGRMADSTQAYLNAMSALNHGPAEVPQAQSKIFVNSWLNNR